MCALLLVVYLIACNQQAKTTVTDNDPLEAGREFIHASLTGDFDYAKKYLLADSTNLMAFDRFVELDQKNTADEKEGFRNANIIIDSTVTVSDSVVVIHYSNTFKKVPSRVKIVRQEGKWKVDFKYTFIDQ